MERDELKFTDIELYNISQSILTRYQMIPDESQNEQYNLWELYKKVQAEIIRRNVMAAMQAPVRAEWIVDPDEGTSWCSNCHAEFEDRGDTIPDYWYFCPNCGAKMDGKD